MRKLALLTTALLGFAFVVPSFAQTSSANSPNQAGPQPGLPPGAGVGAVNAQPPGSAGRIATTPVAPAPMADMSSPTPPPARATRHRTRRHRVVHHRARRAHAAPATTDAPAANQ